MGYNFLPVERDQLYLMPPSVTDWLPEDHLAFFVLDAVEQMDLSAFYADYRQDGWGAAAHEPAMMVGLLVYAYCVGVRSSRQIERACHLDVAFRVIAANQTPDHTTISRFSARHEQALSSAFCESLRLCAKAGMAMVGIVAVDGTKMAADASRVANRTSAHIDAEVAKILAEAAAIDAAEDAQFGPDARGDEPPATLRGREDRRKRFAEAKALLDAERAEAEAAHLAHLARRAALEAERGKQLRGRKPVQKSREHALANTSDPQSRLMKTPNGYLQAYNAQAVVNTDQVIVAAGVTNEANDLHQLQPMIEMTTANLEAIGSSEPIGVLLADAGYCSEDNLNKAAGAGPELFVATTKDYKQRLALGEEPKTPSAGGTTPTAREQMAAKLRSEPARTLYKQRSAIVEPVFGQIKQARSIRQFLRRGQTAVNGEWQLICATHNLLKLYRRARTEPTTAPWSRLAGLTI
jgi:transposase